MDENITESLLKCLQVQINLSGKLAVKTSRDASLTALCKAALPPNYMVSAFSVVKAGCPRGKAGCRFNTLIISHHIEFSNQTQPDRSEVMNSIRLSKVSSLV